MELYLLRHGIAVKSDTYLKDEERPLSEKGTQKTKKVAQRLYEIGLRWDLILSSPLVRSRQTAEILQQVGMSDRVEEFAPLAPNGDLQAWVSWCLEHRYNESESRIALVGHQPDLGKWAEILVWGITQEKLIVKKAGLIGLKLPPKETPIGNSELFLLTSPKWLL
jgi:phosphohistidine phosphatase